MPGAGKHGGAGAHLSLHSSLWAGQRQRLELYETLLRLRERLQRPRASQAEPQRPARLPRPPRYPLLRHFRSWESQELHLPACPGRRFRPLQRSVHVTVSDLGSLTCSEFYFCGKLS
ncbi:unnamed protein product [Eretmochelys imbricata]